MNRGLWLRFFGLSVFFALLLAGFYLWTIQAVAGRQSDEVQHSVYLFVARIVEQPPYDEAMARIEHYRAESPAMALQLWIVRADNSIIAANTSASPPPKLLEREKPQQVHEVVTRGRFFSGTRATAIVRLAGPEPLWLLVRNPGSTTGGAFVTLFWIFVATVIGAMFLGLMLVALYLRGRSRQAKAVIADIEAGNLGARFAVDRLDAIGGLMLDFNRMADEIQRLVTQLQSTERARRELLQELGHDLRTPLTSLRTAIETLAAHGESMAAAERSDFLEVAASELAYFAKLIDDLFFIAEIDEPRYRKESAPVDLAALLASELRAARATAPALDWQFTGEHVPAPIAGDPHLLARLLRNLLENAGRHARTRVHASLAREGNEMVVEISDDGEGMSPEAIAAYGQRRTRRQMRGSASGASLGLGSVIATTIVHLHGGRLALANTSPGTRITLRLPV